MSVCEIVWSCVSVLLAHSVFVMLLHKRSVSPSGQRGGQCGGRKLVGKNCENAYACLCLSQPDFHPAASLGDFSISAGGGELAFLTCELVLMRLITGGRVADVFGLQAATPQACKLLR